MQNRERIVFECTRYRTENPLVVCVFVTPVLIPSSTNRRVNSLATYAIRQMRQLYAYVANESTRLLKPFVDPPPPTPRPSSLCFYRRLTSTKGTFLVLYLLFHYTCAAFNLKLPATTQAKPSVLVAFSSRPCVLVVCCGHYKPSALFACLDLAVAITSYKSYPTDKFFHIFTVLYL